AFLGIPRDAIEVGYSAVDVARLAAAGGQTSEVSFAERPFLVVARLVPKKNIARILEAFARYRAAGQDGRELHIIGYGPLREELEAAATRLGIAEAVKFLGAQDSGDVAKAMAGA